MIFLGFRPLGVGKVTKNVEISEVRKQKSVKTVDFVEVWTKKWRFFEFSGSENYVYVVRIIFTSKNVIFELKVVIF